jgi:hypothetical protein
MTVPQGTVSFPGIAADAFIGADYTLSHGISPGICNLRVAAGASLRAEVGDLVFRFGDVRIVLTDCALQQGTLRLGRSGHVWNLRIVDRRWKWQFGRISGRFNVRREDGKLDPQFEELPPRALAGRLLDAMNERGYDVSALPEGPRPEIQWEEANPAEELAELCDSLGCRVVLGTDNRVRIRRLAVGRRLPDGGLAMNAGEGIEHTVPPDEILLACGPTIVQSKLRLEAVGEDVDGRIKPIEKLSYKPDDGWSSGPWNAKTEPTYEQDGKSLSPADLAEKTVFRLYRVKEQATGGLQVSRFDSPEIDSPQQYVLRDRLLPDNNTDDEREQQARPAYVEGKFYDELAEAEGNTTAGTPFRRSFSLDAQRQIVAFDRPVFQIDASGGYRAAEVFLVTSYYVRGGKENALVHRVIHRRIGKGNRNTGPRVEHHPEIFATVRVTYRGETSLDRVETNFEQVDRQARDYLDAVERRYTDIDRTTEVQYAGLVDISPDGAVQQVTWRVGDGAPATTRASRNSEGSLQTPSYAERRRRERAVRGPANTAIPRARTAEPRTTVIP